MILSRYGGRFPVLFQASPGRWRMTVEMTLTSLGAILVGQSFHLPFTDIYPILIMVLWKDNRVLNIALGLAVTLIFGLLCLMVLFATIASADNNSLKFIIDLGFAFLFFFLTVGSKLGVLLGPICGLVSTYGLLEVSQIPHGELITEGLLYLFESICISTGAMILGALVMGRSPKTVLCRDIAFQLRVSADLLSGQNRGSGSWRESRNLMEKGAMPLLTKVKLASMEKIWSQEILNRLRQASLHTFSCLALSRMAVEEIGWQEISADPFAAELAKTMREMADIFDRGDLAQATVPLPEAEVCGHSALNEIACQLAVFSEKSAVVFPQAPKTGFILPNAFKSAENYRFAAKGTLTVAICICFYLALDWSGIHTCVITCFLVGLPTVGAMVAKQTARISGTLIGSVYVFWSMIFALPHFTNITPFLMLMGAGFLVSGWIKNGPERLSYAGFQISVVLALSDAASNGPSIDLTTPRDRIIGIWIGLVLTYMIFTRLWPTSALTRLPPAFGKYFSAIERQGQSGDRVMRLFWASAAQGALGEARNFLLDARFERVPLRLPNRRLKEVGRALHQAQRLMQTLLLPPSAECLQKASAQRARLERLAEKASLSEISGKRPASKEFLENPAPIS